MELIAVNGATLLQNDANVVCTIVETGIPSTTCKAESNGMLKDNHGILVSNITYPSVGATIPDPGPYSANFITGSTKVKADGTLVLLEKDLTGTINATPQIPGSPNIPYPIAFKVEVKVAGQTTVKAN